MITIGLVLIGIGQWGWRGFPAPSGAPAALASRVAVLRRGAVACHGMGALLIATAVVSLL